MFFYVIDFTMLWRECQKHIPLLRGGTLGVLPLPLARTQFPTRKSSTSSHTGRLARSSRPNPPGRNVRLPVQSNLTRTELIKKHVSEESVFTQSTNTCPAITTPSSQTEEFESVTMPRNTSGSKSFSSAQEDKHLIVPTIQPLSEESSPAVFTESDSDRSAATAMSGNSSQISDFPRASEEPAPNSTIRPNSMITTMISESEPTAEPLARDLQLGRLCLGLMVLTLSPSGLIIMLRKSGETENYIKAARSNKEERVKCNHLECMNIWDPDFAMDAPRNIFTLDGLPEFGIASKALHHSSPAYQVGTEKVVITPTRVGGVRMYGPDGMLLFRSTALSRSSRLQRYIFCPIFSMNS